MRILITGARGFIGSYLFKYFEDLKHDVIGCDQTPHIIDGNSQIKNVSVMSSEFDQLVNKFKPEYCINAAGSGNVALSMQNPSFDFDLNVNLVSKVLDIIRKYAFSCRVLHISSAAVYGNPQKLPINENDSCLPISPYGYHKWMSELLCKEFYTIYGLKMSIVRPFSVYGAGLKKQILWDLCNKCQTEEEIHLFGRGTETRDFIHVLDLCQSIDLILKNSNFELEVYNLGNGNSVEIMEVANKISYRFPGSNIKFNKQVKLGDPLFWKSDNSKIMSLGYVNQVSLEDGINGYVDWFMEQQ